MKKNIDILITSVVTLGLIYLFYGDSDIILVPLLSAFWVLLGIKYKAIYDYRKEFVTKNIYKSYGIAFQKKIFKDYNEYSSIVSNKIKNHYWVDLNRSIYTIFLVFGTIGLLEFFLNIPKSEMIILQLIKNPIILKFFIFPITLLAFVVVLFDKFNDIYVVENAILFDFLKNLKKEYKNLNFFDVLLDTVKENPSEKNQEYLFKVHTILTRKYYKDNKEYSEAFLRGILFQDSTINKNIKNN